MIFLHMASPRTPSRCQGVDLLQAIGKGTDCVRRRERQGLHAWEGKCTHGQKIAARVGERAIWRLQHKEERGKEKRVEFHLESYRGGAYLHPTATPAASVTSATSSTA